MTSPPRSEFQHLFWRLYAPVTAAAVVIVLTAVDRIFVEVGIPYERQIWLFRIAAIVVPAAVFRGADDRPSVAPAAAASSDRLILAVSRSSENRHLGTTG